MVSSDNVCVHPINITSIYLGFVARMEYCAMASCWHHLRGYLTSASPACYFAMKAPLCVQK
jgi:hypothetical protein